MLSIKNSRFTFTVHVFGNLCKLKVRTFVYILISEGNNELRIMRKVSKTKLKPQGDDEN